jgi:hypothetical protein
MYRPPTKEECEYFLKVLEEKYNIKDYPVIDKDKIIKNKLRECYIKTRQRQLQQQQRCILKTGSGDYVFPRKIINMHNAIEPNKDLYPNHRYSTLKNWLIRHKVPGHDDRSITNKNQRGMLIEHWLDTLSPVIKITRELKFPPKDKI